MTNYDLYFGSAERASATMDRLLTSCYGCPLQGGCTPHDEKTCTGKLYRWLGEEVRGYVEGMPYPGAKLTSW